MVSSTLIILILTYQPYTETSTTLSDKNFGHQFIMRVFGTLAPLDNAGVAHNSTTTCVATNRNGATCGRKVGDYSHHIMCKTIGKHNEPHSTVEDIVKRAIEDALGDYIGRGQADVGA